MEKLSVDKRDIIREISLAADKCAIKAAKHAIDSGSKLSVGVNEHGASYPRARRAKKVLQDGIPELLEAVLYGKISLGIAFQIAELDKSEQAVKMEECIKAGHFVATKKQPKSKFKTINEDRVKTILKLTANVRSCCEMGMVSRLDLLLRLKALDDYCNSLVKVKKV